MSLKKIDETPFLSVFAINKLCMTHNYIPHTKHVIYCLSTKYVAEATTYCRLNVSRVELASLGLEKIFILLK